MTESTTSGVQLLMKKLEVGTEHLTRIGLAEKDRELLILTDTGVEIIRILQKRGELNLKCPNCKGHEIEVRWQETNKAIVESAQCQNCGTIWSPVAPRKEERGIRP